MTMIGDSYPNLIYFVNSTGYYKVSWL